MHAPLARHLARFTPIALGALPEATEPLPAPAELPPVELQITLGAAAYGAEIEAARQRVREEMLAGHAAEMERAAAAHRAALEEANAAAAAALAAVEAEQGRTMAAGLADALAALRQELAGQVADSLRPLLIEAVAARTAAAVIEALGQILADPDHPVLTVSGPAGRLAAIEAAFGSRSGIGFNEDEGPEIVVTATGMRLQTRLAAAVAALAAEGSP